MSAKIERSPDSYLPLSTATFHVLLALADGPQHGYAIMKAVAEATDGATSVGPGTLYTSLKRLVSDGVVEETEMRDSTDERRRYYKLTPYGRAVARGEARRLADLVRLAADKRLVRLATT